MFIRTERLFLRPGWPEDLDDLVQAFDDGDIGRDTVVTTLPATAGEIRAYLERARNPRLPHFFMYLRSSAGPELVGGIGLGQYGEDIELGYWIVPRHRGRGFAGEAVRALLEQARTLGHKRLVAVHVPDSGVSPHILEAAGFEDTGRVSQRFGVGLSASTPAKLYEINLDRRASLRITVAAQPLSA